MFPKLIGLDNIQKYFPDLLIDNPFIEQKDVQESKDLHYFGINLDDAKSLISGLPSDKYMDKILVRSSMYNHLTEENQIRFRLSLEEVLLLPL